MHLRRCAGVRPRRLLRQLARPARDARTAAATGHPVVQSFEPGEDWFWDYEAEATVAGPALAAPTSHPDDQPAPGPRGRVPEDWLDHIHR